MKFIGYAEWAYYRTLKKIMSVINKYISTVWYLVFTGTEVKE